MRTVTAAILFLTLAGCGGDKVTGHDSPGDVADADTDADADSDTDADADADSDSDSDTDTDITGDTGTLPGTWNLQGCPPVGSDPYTILQRQITGDSLGLQVQYSGGCQVHQFAPCYGSAFTPGNPVGLDMTVLHDSNMDYCCALITEVVAIDLTPVRAQYLLTYGQASGSVTLNVEGQNVLYSW